MNISALGKSHSVSRSDRQCISFAGLPLLANQIIEFYKDQGADSSKTGIIYVSKNEVLDEAKYSAGVEWGYFTEVNPAKAI